MAAGTDVYYCYEVANTGDVTLNLHDLADTELGIPFAGLPYTLAPGSSVDTVAAGLTISATIGATTVNTATWTAYNAGPTDVVSATATATVTVLPPNIFVDPLAVASSQLPNVQTQHTVVISNTGGALLDWEIFEEPQGVVAQALPGQVAAPATPRDPQAALEAELSGLDGITPAVFPQRDPAAHARARRALLTTGLLLIPDSTADRVMAFDPITGNLLDADFIPADPTNLSTPKNAILSASGTSVLVADQIDDVVQEYDLDGNYLGVFAPAGGANTAILDNITGIDLRPNGNLLVAVQSGANGNSVAEFDTSGNYLGNFVAIGSGGLDGPFDVYPRTADWLVPSINTDNVLRYDVAGAPLGVFAPSISFGQQVAEAGNSNVLVSNFSTPNSGVLEYTPAGALVGVYSGVTGNRGVYELPNGNILTTNGSGVHEIDRLGNLIQTKFSVTGPQYIEYIAPPTTCTNPADVPWLSTSPITGTTPGYDSTDVTVTLDSTGLAPNTYTANLCVTSNDPDAGPGNGTDLVVVPVTLTVTAPQVPAIALAKTVGTNPAVCATDRRDHRAGRHGGHLLLRGVQHRQCNAQLPRSGGQRAGQHLDRPQLRPGTRRIGLRHADDPDQRHHDQHRHLDGLQPGLRGLGDRSGRGDGDGAHPRSGDRPDQDRGHGARRSAPRRTTSPSPPARRSTTASRSRTPATSPSTSTTWWTASWAHCSTTSPTRSPPARSRRR